MGWECSLDGMQDVGEDLFFNDNVEDKQAYGRITLRGLF
jgi:hypothetical protein